MIANYPAFYPLIYHDINLDIPPQHQSLCKAAYRSWQFFICVGVLLDLICCIVIVASTVSFTLPFLWFKILYFFIIPPATFFLLYFPLYKSLKQNHQFYWIVHAIAAITWMGYLALSMFGVIINEQHNSTTNSTELTVPNMYAFPGGETGFFAIGTYFKYRFLSSGVAGLVARLWWMVALVFYAVQSRNIYNVYTTGSATQTKLGSKSPESAELGQVDRSKGQVGGVVNVNGRDVNVSVDTKTATSVASKAYSSGAAGQLVKGAKVDKNGNVVIDPNSAMNAAKTMHASGATKELAAGMTVSSGGYSAGPTVVSGPGPATAGRGQYVKAIHDFAGGEQGDLPLRQGDRVLVVKKVDENWYEGSVNGKTGIFPSKFVTNA